MLKEFSFILFIIALLSCNENNSHDVNIKDDLEKDSLAKSVPILFADPVLLDSSAWIIYPLIFARSSYDNSYLSKSRDVRTSYWNLFFYNVETNTKRLLTTE